jgi:hypothetical protein
MAASLRFNFLLFTLDTLRAAWEAWQEKGAALDVELQNRYDG